MRFSSRTINVSCLFLLLIISACSPKVETDSIGQATSPARFSENSSSASSLSEVEVIPTLRSTPTVIISINAQIQSTPFPMPEHPKSVSDFTIIQKTDFTTFVSNDNISYRNASGMVELKELKNWRTIETLSPYIIAETEGILFRFQIKSYSDRPKIFLEAISKDGRLLRWGVSLDYFPEVYARENEIVLSKDNLRGNTQIFSEKWYYLLLTVDTDAKFGAILWDVENPDSYREIYEQLPVYGYDLLWKPEVRLSNGILVLDEYSKTNIQINE